MHTKAHRRVATWHGEIAILQKAEREADRASEVVAAIVEVIAVVVVVPEETVHGVEMAKGNVVMGSAAADAVSRTPTRKKMANMILTIKTVITEVIVAAVAKEAAEVVHEVAPIIEEDVVNTVKLVAEPAEAMPTNTKSQNTNQLMMLNTMKAANSTKMSSILLMRKCEIMKIN